jgi:biopolymer transport protein TolR
MAGSFGSSPLAEDDLFSGINVTPLVDVVLVLLIIFMITAPVIYQSAIKVQLPKAKTGEQSGKGPLQFSLSKEGTISWGQNRMDWATLKARLSKLGEEVKTETAVITADEASPHGTVIKLMDTLREFGLTHFALSVETTK